MLMCTIPMTHNENNIKKVVDKDASVPCPYRRDAEARRSAGQMRGGIDKVYPGQLDKMFWRVAVC